MKGSIVGGASEITYWYDSSVTNYGFQGSLDNGIAEWDAASSKVGFKKSSTASAAMKVYVGYNALPDGTYGETTYWNYNWLGQVEQVSAPYIQQLGDSFEQARIVLDHGNQDEMGFDYTHRYKTSGHEIGHVLSLAHFEDSPAHLDKNWMTSGKISLTKPTSTDLAHLRTKWGW
ncbi:hypothetical protein AB3N00_17480 [Paenibacillus xylanilyticus]